jgi:hypothetical protein
MTTSTDTTTAPEVANLRDSRKELAAAKAPAKKAPAKNAPAAKATTKATKGRAGGGQGHQACRREEAVHRDWPRAATAATMTSLAINRVDASLLLPSNS